MNDNDYHPPWFLSGGHIQTIFPALFRKITDSSYDRERIHTPDGDFLDLDWSTIRSRRLAVISHGLEGSSSRAYVRGMARAVNCGGWDALAWNFRGCSEEPNKRLRFYHNSATDDLSWVIDHAAKTGLYEEIALIGFSLGGNLTLVHLGRDRVNPIVSRAAVFSVPCHLESAADVLNRPSNRIYLKRFLHLLHGKIRSKMAQFPGQLDDTGYEKIKTFQAFDNRYTAPIHGFKDALDYWQKSSALQFISAIEVPTLIVNAANDPFLSEACYPVAEADQNSHVTLKIPKAGGHVGFTAMNRSQTYWSEHQAVSFLNGHL